jgi:hypothetical protein
MSTEATPWFAINHRLRLVGNAMTLAAANAIKTIVDNFLNKGDVELPLLDAVQNLCSYARPAMNLQSQSRVCSCSVSLTMTMYPTCAPALNHPAGIGYVCLFGLTSHSTLPPLTAAVKVAPLMSDLRQAHRRIVGTAYENMADPVPKKMLLKQNTGALCPSKRMPRTQAFRHSSLTPGLLIHRGYASQVPTMTSWDTVSSQS